MSTLIVSGLRTCERKETVFAEISRYVSEIGSVKEIVAGGSTGVDAYAKEYAQVHNLKYKEYAPNWQDDLNAAGLIRDARMAEYGTHLLVLSNGASKESKNLISEAKRNNLAIKTVGVFEDMPDADSKVSTGIPSFY